MPRTRVTLADLKLRLKERVGDTPVFWKTEEEAKDALNEAIALWQALSGEWVTRISVPAVTDFPSFYPVPKQIVSLTRVSLSDTTTPPALGVGIYHSAFPSFYRGHSNNPIFTSATGRPIYFAADATGGVGPFSFLWTFPDGTTSTDQSPVWFFPTSMAEGAYNFSATVTDATGATNTQTIPITLMNQTVSASCGSPLAVVGGDLVSSLVARVAYNGSTSTEFNATTPNQYPRYPLTITFDFACQGTFPAEPKAGRVINAEIRQNGGSGLIRGTDGKFTYVINSGFHFSNGFIGTSAVGGKYLGQSMFQDVDNDVWNTSVPEVWLIFDVPTSQRITNGDTFTGSFKIQVTDVTGYTAETTVNYTYAGTAPLVADFTYHEESRSEGVTTMHFLSTTTGGTTPYTTYDWNWGDGDPHGNTANPTHAYHSSNTFTVTLTVTDSAAATDSESKSIVITVDI